MKKIFIFLLSFILIFNSISPLIIYGRIVEDDSVPYQEEEPSRGGWDDWGDYGSEEQEPASEPSPVEPAAEPVEEEPVRGGWDDWGDYGAETTDAGQTGPTEAEPAETQPADTLQEPSRGGWDDWGDYGSEEPVPEPQPAEPEAESLPELPPPTPVPTPDTSSYCGIYDLDCGSAAPFEGPEPETIIPPVTSLPTQENAIQRSLERVEEVEVWQEEQFVAAREAETIRNLAQTGGTREERQNFIEPLDLPALPEYMEEIGGSYGDPVERIIKTTTDALEEWDQDRFREEQKKLAEEAKKKEASLTSLAGDGSSDMDANAIYKAKEAYLTDVLGIPSNVPMQPVLAIKGISVEGGNSGSSGSFQVTILPECGSINFDQGVPEQCKEAAIKLADGASGVVLNTVVPYNELEKAWGLQGKMDDVDALLGATGMAQREKLNPLSGPGSPVGGLVITVIRINELAEDVKKHPDETLTPEQREIRKRYADKLRELWHDQYDLSMDTAVATALTTAGKPLKIGKDITRPVWQPVYTTAERKVAPVVGGLIGRGREFIDDAWDATGGRILRRGPAGEAYADAILVRTSQEGRTGVVTQGVPSGLEDKYTMAEMIKMSDELVGRETSFHEAYTYAKWLDKGVPENVIKENLATAEKAADYLASGKKLEDAPEDIKQAVSVFRYTGADLDASYYYNAVFSGKPDKKLLKDDTKEVSLAVLNALLERRNRVDEIDLTIRRSVPVINNIKKMAVRDGADAVSLSRVNANELLNPDHIQVLTKEDYMRALGRDKAAGTYIVKDDQILIHSEYSGSVAVCAHECIHRSSYTNNPAAQKKFRKAVGEENYTKFEEGLTEFSTLSGEKVTYGKLEYDNIYAREVKAIREDVIPSLMEAQGYSEARARALLLEISLTGDYEKFLIEMGKGDLATGAKKVKSIYDRVPETGSNVVTSTKRVVTPTDVVIAALVGGGGGYTGYKLLNGETPTPTLVPTSTPIPSLAPTSIPPTPTPMPAVIIDFRPMSTPTPIPPTPTAKIVPTSTIMPTYTPAPRSLNLNLISKSYASEKTEDKLNGLDVDTLENLVKKQLIKQALEEDGEVDSDYIERVMKIDVVEPAFSKLIDGYLFTTGKAGLSEGKIEKDHYKVEVDSLAETDITIPSFVDIAENTTIPIAIKEGSGKVEKISYRKSNGNFGKVFAEENINSRDLVEAAVSAFNDKNGNGRFDSGEEPLPWAGINVKLTKINQEKDISLLAGWNLLTLNSIPEKPLTASSFLDKVNKQGGNAVAVSSLKDGAWKTFVTRGDKDYSGDDFAIEVGKAYFVKALKKSTFLYTGQNFVAPVKLNLASGWNAVGLPFIQKTYSSSTLMESINSKAANADTLSRWESGLWDTFVEKQEQKYGNDFEIVQNRGYLIKVEKNVEFEP